MKEISGIKSIDFKIDASGYGAVNWNGSISLYNKEIGKQIDNHSIPKLRGYTNLTGETITKDVDVLPVLQGGEDVNLLDKYTNDKYLTSQKTKLQHMIYWHHSKILRKENDFSTIGKIFDFYRKKII